MRLLSSAHRNMCASLCVCLSIRTSRRQCLFILNTCRLSTFHIPFSQAFLSYNASKFFLYFNEPFLVYKFHICSKKTIVLSKFQFSTLPCFPSVFPYSSSFLSLPFRNAVVFCECICLLGASHLATVQVHSCWVPREILD